VPPSITPLATSMRMNAPAPTACARRTSTNAKNIGSSLAGRGASHARYSSKLANGPLNRYVHMRPSGRPNSPRGAGVRDAPRRAVRRGRIALEHGACRARRREPARQFGTDRLAEAVDALAHARALRSWRTAGGEPCIELVALHELGVRALRDDAPLVHHHDAVDLEHRGEPMGDDDRGTAPHQLLERPPAPAARSRVECARRFVEQQDRRSRRIARAMAMRWRCRREPCAAFAEERVVALWQPAQELVGRSGTCAASTSASLAPGVHNGCSREHSPQRARCPAARVRCGRARQRVARARSTPSTRMRPDSGS